jgi:hypothetical protein
MTTQDNRAAIRAQGELINELTRRLDAFDQDYHNVLARLDHQDKEIIGLGVHVGEILRDFENDNVTSRFNALEETCAGLNLRLDRIEEKMAAQRTHVDTLFATWEGMQERAGDRLRERLTRRDADHKDGLRQIMLRLDELLEEVQLAGDAGRE